MNYLQYARAVAGNRADRRGGPARQESLREHNLALVLAEVADAGPISRAGIAAATGLTKATVSSLVDALVAAGLVAELDRAASPARAVGRPAAPLGLAPPGPLGIGLEINVDYLSTCTVDLSGEVRNRCVTARDFRGCPAGEVLDLAAERLAVAISRAVDVGVASGDAVGPGAVGPGAVRPVDGVGGVRVAGLAVAVPGLVQTGEQVLRIAPNLGWRDVAVLDELRARLADRLPEGLPMRLDNEANFGALGELWSGDHRNAAGGPLQSFVHVSGEIGIGAGLVVHGGLFRGVRGFSGEIGHLPVRDGGPACRCGSVGCLEQVAGQDAILRAAGLDVPAGSANGGADAALRELVARARAGRPEALAAITGAGRWLGTGIAALLNVVDVDAVVLGGSYARLAPWLREPVEAELSRRVLSAPWGPPRVLVSALGAEAAVRGAAISVVRDVIAHPAAYLTRPTPTRPLPP